MLSFSSFVENAEVHEKDLREAFVKGQLLKEGHKCFLKGLNDWAEIVKIGPNYIIVETDIGKSRHWLSDIDWDQGINAK